MNLLPKKLKNKFSELPRHLLALQVAVFSVAVGFALGNILGSAQNASVTLEAPKESVLTNLHKLVLDPEAFVVERKATKQIFGHHYDEAIFRIRGGIAVYAQRVDGVCCTAVPIAGSTDTLPKLTSRPGVLGGEFGASAPFALLKIGTLGTLESMDGGAAEEKLFGNQRTEGVLPLGSK